MYRYIHKNNQSYNNKKKQAVVTWSNLIQINAALRHLSSRLGMVVVMMPTWWSPKRMWLLPWYQVSSTQFSKKKKVSESRTDAFSWVFFFYCCCGGRWKKNGRAKKFGWWGCNSKPNCTGKNTKETRLFLVIFLTQNIFSTHIFYLKASRYPNNFFHKRCLSVTLKSAESFLCAPLVHTSEKPKKAFGPRPRRTWPVMMIPIWRHWCAISRFGAILTAEAMVI